MKNFCSKTISIIVIGATGLMLLLPGTTTAASSAAEQACRGANLPGCTAPSDSTSVEGAVAAAVNILSFIIGIAAVIMLIVGGLKYITSSGDSASINSAKNTIIYALVGIVVAAVAQGLVQLVLKRL